MIVPIIIEKNNSKINNESNDVLIPKNDKCSNMEINNSAPPNLNTNSKTNVITTILIKINKNILKILFFKM